MGEKFILKEGVELGLFDDGSKEQLYLISYGKRNWKVSESVYQVCRVLESELDLEEVSLRVCEGSSTVFNTEFIENVLKFLKLNGLIKGYETSQPKRKNKMLWGRITLFPESALCNLRIFDFIYNKYFFLLAGILAVLWLFWICLSNSSSSVAKLFSELDFLNILICYGYIMLFGIIHEFGHVIALLKYKEKPGRIGAGVYLFMPVFFSEVTKAWKIKRVGRLCVDIGGVYLQSLMLMLTYFFNLTFIKSQVLMTAILLSTFQIFTNFNPFIKMDGYWILCDALGITNVYTAIYELFASLFQTKKPQRLEARGLTKRKKVFLYSYTIVISSFMIYFVRIILFSSKVAMQLVKQDIINLVSGHFSMSSVQVLDVFKYISNRFSSLIMIVFILRLLIMLIQRGISLFLKKVRYAQNESD